MDFAIVVMQILAVVYIVTGLKGLLDDSFFENLGNSLQKNTDSGYLWGLIGIVVGMVLVSNPNIHLTDWTAILAVFGWISLFKGIAIIWIPQEFLNQFSFARSKKNSFAVSIAVLILGLVCAYFGFFA